MDAPHARRVGCQNGCNWRASAVAERKGRPKSVIGRAQTHYRWQSAASRKNAARKKFLDASTKQ
jgi:hypothetical protein